MTPLREDATAGQADDGLKMDRRLKAVDCGLIVIPAEGGSAYGGNHFRSARLRADRGDYSRWRDRLRPR